MSISRDFSKFIEADGQLAYDNTNSGLSATTVKSAIDELNVLVGGGNVGSQASFDAYDFTATASQTTFSLSSNHGQGSDIVATDLVEGTEYIIISTGTTDFTLIGAADSNPGTTFTKNATAGLGTGTAKVVATYVPGYIQVYVNGVLLSETDYVASDGDNVVLDTGADVGALVTVVTLDSFNTATQLRVLNVDAGAPDNSVSINSSGNLVLPDNGKAIFGAGSDLQIYHDGINSYIDEQGTGTLYVKADSATTITNAAGDVISARFRPNTFVSLYYNGVEKLGTTDTGIDVTGNVTADGLTVDSSSGITVNGPTNQDGKLNLVAYAGVQDAEARIQAVRGNTSGTDSRLQFLTNNGTSLLTRVDINDNGDISFYEDTGANAKLVWKAADEFLGIGTTSPFAKLSVTGASASANDSGIFQITDGTGANTDTKITMGVVSSDYGWIQAVKPGTDVFDLVLNPNGGNVGIGTVSPSYSLDVDQVGTNSTGTFLLTGGNSASNDYTQTALLKLRGTSINPNQPSHDANSSVAEIRLNHTDLAGDASSGNITFHTNPSNNISGSLAERMVIDRVGNLAIANGNQSANDVSSRIMFGNKGTFSDSGIGRAEIVGVSEGTFWYSGTALAFLTNPGPDVTSRGPDERMRIDSSGNLLLQQTSAAVYDSNTTGDVSNFWKMSVSGSSTATRSVMGSNTTGGIFGGTRLNTGGTRPIITAFMEFSCADTTAGAETGEIYFYTKPSGGVASSTKRMIIDSSGNLLVGTDTTTAGNEGMVYFNGDSLRVSRDSAEPLNLDRFNTDGSVIDIKRDNVTLGSIGVEASDLVIDGGAANHSGLRFFDAHFSPRKNGVMSDNTIDVGSGSYRFNDAYITNGVTTGSDGNDKQDIETLSDAEQRVAVACKGLLRKWRWKDAVEAKGDEARIHFGIIAQDLQAAFEAEGLDAGRYAMFIHSTWTDKETGEERSRMGVRYSELLAFIIAAL